MAFHRSVQGGIDWRRDPAAKAKLEQLWGQTDPVLSAPEIAAHFSVSKSSIVSAVKNLKLPGRPSPIGRRKNNGAGSRKPNPRPVPPPPLPSQVATAPAPIEPEQPRRRLRADDVSSNGCCWPMGEPGSKEFRFCGEDVARPGKPYCIEHAAMSVIDPTSLQRERIKLPEVEAYAAEHRVVPRAATGLSGLLVAVNIHRRTAGLIPFSVAREP